MSFLTPLCQQVKQKHSPKKVSLTTPVRFWSEQDRHKKSVVKAFVIILRTQGCSWSQSNGCTMCGYFTDSAKQPISSQALLNQFQKAMNHYDGEIIIKIFTSGSFFNPNEIPEKIQKEIITLLAEKAKHIVIESRPEYISKALLDKISPILRKTTLEVGIGLETANDFIRKHAINKGFTYHEFKKAVDLLKQYNIGVKTYVLIKPLFLTEKKSIEDCLATVDKIKDETTTISFNPTNVQRYTVVEYLWRRQYYRPPWLWSVIEILNKSAELTKTRLQCDIVGGGSRRGAHNCGKCDADCLQSIRKFSLTQNPIHLKTIPSCKCKNIWQHQCASELFTFGSLIDYRRKPQ